MPIDCPAFEDVRKNAAAIIALCQQELKAFGFIHRARMTIWRRTNVKFDVLKINLIPDSRCEKWRVPIGSFSLDPSCLFPFLPRPGHIPTKALHPEMGFGQLRLSIRKGISQRQVKTPNICWPGRTEDSFREVAADVVEKIKTEVLPFFSRFEEPKELLRTLLEDDDAIGREEGVWEFGKKGSPRRLLYLGFSAIECTEWELAISSLRACEEKIRALPEPPRERVRAEYLPYLEQGTTCAKHRCAWNSGNGLLCGRAR